MTTNIGEALTHTDLSGLQLLSRGKVRDIYATSSPDLLLFVATDRISAFDVILKNGIPGKGALLTAISLFWFHTLAHIVPHHLVSADVDGPGAPPELHAHASVLRGRSMLVRRARVVPMEAIVRGYLTGSAWNEYKRTGTVHGIELPPGMLESQRFPEPMFTPSTKAEQGTHDENISPAQAEALLGSELYNEIRRISLALYREAAAHALARGIILADTKFEFGLVGSLSPPIPASTTSTSPTTASTLQGGTLILIDELLTPDSSRYWPLSGYALGRAQPSFDKQFLRDWMLRAGFVRGCEGGPPGRDGEGWVAEEEVVRGTRARYEEVVQRLQGESVV